MEDWNKKFNALLDEAIAKEINPLEVLYILKRCANDIEFQLMAQVCFDGKDE